MSLVVWLPLTKDLRQQGLANTSTITLASGNAFVDGGKVGNKALHLTKQQTILGTSSCMSGKKQMSYAFWVKVNTAWSAQWLDGIAWYSTDGSSAAYSRQEFYTNCTRIGTWFSGSSLSGYVFTPGEWTHIAGTFDYTAGIAKFYINGVLQGTSTSLSKTHYCRGDFYIGDNGVDIVENDVRIYDHCLSPMEVKELAKGLVLHYPLNRQGWGQENLLPGSYRADGNTTNKIYGWQANGNGTPEIIKVDNIDCIHLQANCTGKYIPSIVSASKVFLEYGVEYTISCDLKFDKDITVTNSTPIHYHSGSSSSTDEFNTANINNGHGFNFKSISPAAGTTIPANTWQHYEQHIIAKTAPTDSSLPYLTYRAFIYGSVRTISETVSVNMWLKNWKIEKGSIATPWCPNSSDTLATAMGLNSTTEYDCSGFCNNGTRTGTFSWTSDTPKYQVSTKFSQSRIQCNGDFLYGLSTATLSAWVKLTAYHSERCMVVYANGRYLTINNNGQLSGYSYGKTPAGYYNSSQTIPLNTWTHITIVWDDTTWYFYINGVLVNSWACTGTFTNVGSYASVGQESNGGRSVSGLISDARVYATALSASDVKSLYQNSAYIDSSGNVYGAVHSEV